jgi:hypothetical protein
MSRSNDPPNAADMSKREQVWLIACVVAMSPLAAAPAGDSAQTFDPTHGVILSGLEGRSVADACSGKPTSASWALKFDDIDRVERTLAPLLAADLKNIGSNALVREYYRQYATGYLDHRRAIFVNGFHESQLSSLADRSLWLRTAVSASDGGDSYWCAIYIEDTGQFVKFKGNHLDTHVWFHGLA